MELKKVSDLPNANDVKSDDLIMLIQQNAGESTSTKITVEKLKEYFSTENMLIKTIDLTEASTRISIWDYMERDEVQTFSDMMLDYMNDNGITDYKSNKFYAEYVPDLIDSEIEESGWDVEWDDIFAEKGFVSEKVRTAHILDKNTKAVVAKVNYIGNDDHDSILGAYIEQIATQIVPVEPTNIDYYIKMLNYGLKNGVTLIEEGEECISIEKVESKILNLIEFPFDNKRLQFGLVNNMLDDADGPQVTFMYSIDFPTGCIPTRNFYCYGTLEWVIKPDQIR